MPTTYAIPNGRTVMNATLYTGNGTAVTVTNNDNGTVGFKPDFVWLKSRSNATNNTLWDSVRGATNYLVSNTNAAEATYAGGLTAFNSNGFSIGDGSDINVNAATYVGWQWQAGQGTTSSNTNGSITSTVSVNATAGFSIITFTGNGTAGATIGHGLGVAPELLIFKGRNTGTDGLTWFRAYNTNQGQMQLDSTAAIYNPGNGLYFNSTYPSSSVITLGTSGSTNGNTQTYVVYAWASIAGFSAFGSYTGNGSSDGPFIYTGFRPKWIMIKRSDSTSSWYVIDTSINPYNEEKTTLYPNLSNAAGTNANFLDGLSNGFKMRESGVAVNGGTYVYAAFAENPFKYANAR